ncbi:Xaa-Pro dipeptidase [Sphingomonas sp. KC8]|uniref:Xaa-Pro dipeptidase n=1 Tax=Sphingomonas sp. KC8 TaxID=1030157 RepID=UPI0002488B49|nr:amidohydrolase family protein [Sphingomonas sp. KC8]ARS28674.1 hydrolase [Sphingomonas sp. KC8]
MKQGLTALAALLLATVAAPAAAGTVVVTAAHMLDVKTGKLVDEPVVVIVDGRIQSVVTRGGARPVIPDGARRVDLGAMTILPGLIDMHVHLDSNPVYGGYTGLQFTDSFWTVQGVANAKAMLDAGFTTVRNVGSANYSDVGMKQAIDAGLVIGPRIVPAAHALGATGGHCDETYLPPSFHAKGEAVGDSVDELRQRVREQRKYGAEVIKVCATGGVFSRNTEPGQQQLSEAELKGIADEAHMWGLKVAAHAHGVTGIKAAIRAGIDTIEHASLIDDEGIRLAKERGAYLAMDIFNTDYTQAEGAKNGVMEDNLRKDREVADIQRENFRKAHAAGVKLVFATDAGVMPHGTAAGQLAVMVRYGMTPTQAIQAATVTAAAALGRDATVGSIAPGRYGDIIAVAGDPTRDVRLLESVPFVMKGGDVVKTAN